MKKAKRITGLILAASMLAVMLAAQVFYLSAEETATAPPATREYLFSQYTDISQLAAESDLLAYSMVDGTASLDTERYFFLRDGADVGLSGGKVLGEGTEISVSRRSTLISPQPYADTKNDQTYPVSEIRGKRLIPLWGGDGNQRFGIAFYHSVKAGSAVDNGDDTSTTADVYYGNVIGLVGDEVTGLTLKRNATNLTVTTIKNIETGAVISVKVTTSHSDSSRESFFGSALAAFAASGTGLTDFFIGKTEALTEAERWADYRLYYEDGDTTKPRIELTLALADGAATRNVTLTVPSKITNSSNTYPPNPAIGAAYHQNNADAVGTYMSDMTVYYDLSAYYVGETTSINAAIEALSPYTVDETAQLKAVLARYDALPEGVRPQVTKIENIRSALAAFNEGKFFYDDFEGSKTDLSWSLAGHITGLTETGDGNWPANPKITFSDYQTPTNIYSAAAAGVFGDQGTTSMPSPSSMTQTDIDNLADDTAFWGIHTDTNTGGNVNNNALWLRKTLNGFSLRPNYSDNQSKPTRVAVMEPGLIPEGAKIASVSGRFYASNNSSGGTKYAMGVVYRYTDEFHWETLGIDGQGYLQIIERNDEYTKVGESWGRTFTIRSDSRHNALVFPEGSGIANYQFALNQWMNFSMRYDTEKGYYVMTVSGIKSGTASEILTVDVGITRGADLLPTVGLVHGGTCIPVFDDISVGLTYPITVPEGVSAPGYAMPGDKVIATVTNNTGRVAGGVMRYEYTPYGQESAVDVPLYARVGSAVYRTAQTYSDEKNNEFVFEMPMAPVDIKADFVSENFGDDAAKYALSVFGVSYMDANPAKEILAGLQFGSRVYRNITTSDGDYTLKNSGSIVVKTSWLDANTTNRQLPSGYAAWIDFLKDADAEKTGWRQAATTTLLDRCGTYVDYALRMVDFEIDMYGNEYVVIAYANYNPDDGGTILYLESALSGPSSYRSAYNKANPYAQLPAA